MTVLLYRLISLIILFPLVGVAGALQALAQDPFLTNPIMCCLQMFVQFPWILGHHLTEHPVMKAALPVAMVTNMTNEMTEHTCDVITGGNLFASVTGGSNSC